MEQLPPEAEALIPKTSLSKNKVPDKGKSDSAPKSGSSDGGVTFKRNLFVREEGTGVKVDKLGNKEQGKTPDKVSFSPELETQYKTFLDRYITNLSRLQKKNPGVLRTLEHKHDADLLTLLSDSEGKPDAKKIEEFLGKPEGWELATMALEYQTAMKLFALGLDAQVSPGGERSTVIDPQTIRLNVDRGVGNKFLHDKVLSYLNKHTRMTGERHNVPDYNSPFNQMLRNLSPKLPIASGLGFISGAGLYGGIIGGPVGGALGLGASALGVAGVAGVGRLMRDGVRIDTRQCSAAFGQIANNPTEAAFVKEMFGVDVNDFQDSGNNRIVRAQGRASESTNNQQVWDEVLGAFYTRESYYTALGIPPSKLDAGFYQMVGSYTTGQVEQAGTLTLQRFQEVFQPNNGGLTDNVADNISRSRDAWRTVMREKMTQMIQKAKEKKGITDDAKLIAEKIADRTSDEGIKKKKIAELEKQKTEIEKPKEVLTAQQEKIKAYALATEKENEALEEFNREFPEYAEGSIDQAITAKTQELIDTKANLVAKENENILLIIQEALNQFDPLPQNAPKDEVKKREILLDETRKNTVAQHQREIDRIKENIGEITGKINTLQGLRKQNKEYEKTLKSSEDSVLSGAKEDIPQLITIYDKLTGTPANGNPSLITDTELRTKSVADLVKLANQQYEADKNNPAVAEADRRGWPESQNNAENRSQMLKAVTEARARYEGSLDSDQATRLPDFEAVITAGVTEEQLRSLTQNQLQTLIGNPDITGEQIKHAITEARQRMILRNKIHTNLQLEDIVNLGKDIEKQKENMDKAYGEKNPEVQLLRVTQDLMTRQGELFGNTLNITSDPNKYVSTVSIEETDQYSAEEKATFKLSSTTEGRLPAGYFELMNYVFDYQEKSNRGEYFGQLVKLLPPQKFAEILNRSFSEQLGENSLNLPTMPANAETTIHNVILFMNQRIQTGAIGSFEMRHAVKAVIDELRNEARAL